MPPSSAVEYDDMCWADILEELEIYYRESKLKKPVWGNITPHLMKYVALQSLLSIVQNASATVSEIENITPQDHDSPEMPPTPVDESSGELTLSNDLTLAEYDKECERLYRKLLIFWDTVPPELRKKAKETIIASICARAEKIQAYEATQQRPTMEDFEGELLGVAPTFVTADDLMARRNTTDFDMFENKEKAAVSESLSNTTTIQRLVHERVIQNGMDYKNFHVFGVQQQSEPDSQAHRAQPRATDVILALDALIQPLIESNTNNGAE